MNFHDWINQIKPEKKLRTYQHIDDPLDLSDAKIFAKVVRIIEKIKDHQFLPFIKRTEIKIRFRKNKEGKVRRTPKPRPIMYAAHIDAHIYSYYNFVLSDIYEAFLKKLDISENVIAYRKIEIGQTGKGKSNVHFAKEVFDHIQKQTDCVVITQDIEKFFDSLDHGFLKKKICKICDVERLDESFYKVFRSLTAFRYIEYFDFLHEKIKGKTRNNKYAIYKILKGLVKENRSNKAIPQGSPISGLLANIYLIDFDTQIKTVFPDVFYRRYSDDLVFVCKRDQKDALLKFIDENIKNSLLTINPGKSFISYFKRKENGDLMCEKVTDGLDNASGRNYVDYLGLEFGGKTIYLRKNTIQKLKSKQIKKARRHLLNTRTQVRRRPKKIRSKNKSKNNYFKNALRTINNPGIKKQILKVTRDRNKVKV